MLLWLKKLLKPRWVVSYDCEECMNHFCGACGRGVSEANYFYTKKAAIKDAEEWVNQQRQDVDHVKYELVHTETVDTSGDMKGYVHRTIVLHYNDDGREGDCSIFACVDSRRYW